MTREQQITTPEASAVSPARTVSHARITEKARQFPALFPIPLDTHALSPRDARLANAIDRQVTTRWSTLRAFIEPHLKDRWDDQHPALISSLLGGAAQLLLLDRIPDHAAIGQSVQWCKSTPARRASGVVNAVLRKVAGTRNERVEKADPDRDDHLLHADGSGWTLTKPVFAGTVNQRLARQSGCPRTLIDRWTSIHGADEARRLALHAMAAGPVTINGAGSHPALAPHDLAPCQILAIEGQLGEVLEAFPNAIVQGPTAAAAVQATAELDVHCIVDWCAGRGTKTRQLAAMHPSARIIASDGNAHRRNHLGQGIAGIEQLEVLDPSDANSHAGCADLLVLDVPCTNSGVLSRRPEARHRQDQATRMRLRDLQRQIVADSLALLADDGALLWTTCSIDPEENEHQVEWLEQWHGLHPISMHLERGRGGPGDPGATWLDGGFHALLRRG